MIYLLCAALALACVALAIALRRARAEAAFQRHQVVVDVACGLCSGEKAHRPGCPRETAR